jgi:hypothetical protein
MKSIIKCLGLCSILAFTGCLDLDLQNNPNEVTEENASLDLYLNSIQLAYADFSHRSSDLAMPVVRQRAMTGGNQYDNAYNPQSFNGIWSLAYSRLLTDLDEVIRLAAEGGFTYHGGIAKVIKANVLMTLVDMFGGVPYANALQGLENPNPSPDNDEAVYAAALGLLDEAITDLSAGGANPALDMYYGSANGWVKAANSLMLKHHLNTRLVNESGSKTAINALIDGGNLITSAADDFQFTYGTNRSNPDSRHPYYTAQYETNNGQYMSNFLMWSMYLENTVVDPRLRYYFYRQDGDVTDEDQFTLDCVSGPRPAHYPDYMPFCTASDDGYWGRDHGNDDGIPPDGTKRTVYGMYPAGGKFDDDSFASTKNGGVDGAGGAGITPIMLASYVDFMLAEASLTMGTTGDARTYLLGGITKSVAKVTGFGAAGEALAPTQQDMDAYINSAMVRYDAAADDEARLNVIMREYWVASFGCGMEAYNGYRRTGYPADMQETREVDAGTFPRLMLYPESFVNLSSNGNQHAIDTQVFWDNNQAGFIN